MIRGEGIRLEGDFSTAGFNGAAVDPENLVVKIYDSRDRQVGDDWPTTRTGEGMYYCDLILPTAVGEYLAMWEGTAENLPIRAAQMLSVRRM